MATSNRRKRLAESVPSFMKEYARKKRRGSGLDPNDRRYDRGLEEELKRLKPEEFDKLIHGDHGDTRHPRPAKSARNPRRGGKTDA